MTTTAKIIADSIAEGVRLITFEVYFPRFILAQVNTHRVFSRSYESSRAIPVEKKIQAVLDDPVIPREFGKNQRGMQPGEALDDEDATLALLVWSHAYGYAIEAAKQLAKVGVHKQLANRLIEPFAHVKGIITATEWDNFFNLRRDDHAQREIHDLADAMWDARGASNPSVLEPGDWHLPYWAENGGSSDDMGVVRAVKVSCARCARISYLSHDGRRDIDQDLRLYADLRGNGHMGALEHAAQVAEWTGGHWCAGDVLEAGDFCGNFRLPWVQHRKMIPGEAVFGSAG